MATAAASPPAEAIRNPLNLKPKEFGEKLDQLAKHQNNLQKLSAKVYSLGKTQRLQYPNGQTVGRKELRSLNSQFVKEIKDLKKNYTAHGKRLRKPRSGKGKKAGFSVNGIFVSDNMREFFKTANLGPSDPLNPASAPLNSVLSVGINGTTTHGIMTPLWNIYIYMNKMQKDPQNKQYNTATAEMNRYFQDTYRTLEAMDQRYFKADKHGVRKPIPKFHPDRFRFANVQQIVSVNSIKKKDLDPQRLAILEDPVTKTRLQEEQALVSHVNDHYRWVKSGMKKTFAQFRADEIAKKEKRRRG